ncbi:MAG: 6-hydroxynicotinate reductase [Thalassobaculum sp.]
MRCDACPVLCRIREGKSGACDRYANVAGELVRLDPLVVTERVAERDGRVVPFLETAADWDGRVIADAPVFVTGIGSGTTYPDYKPAPFIVGAEWEGVDTVTVVTEGIFSYCGVKVKIDTDRHLGPEAGGGAGRRRTGRPCHHRGVRQPDAVAGRGASPDRRQQEGRQRSPAPPCWRCVTGRRWSWRSTGGSRVTVQAGKPPVVDGEREERMRVGCGSATIGIFARQWLGHADEVIVVDDHITGVLSEHQAGRFLDMKPGGIRVRGRKSTPGRYFQVAEPGSGWGGTDVTDPLDIIDRVDPKTAWPGERVLMVSTTGEDSAYFELDEGLNLVARPMPKPLEVVVDRIGENCEPALCTVLFMGGAGGSLRAGVTENPVRLTRSVQSMITRVTCGGAPVYVWPGGGITLMVDVTRLPKGAFGYVPTPALVAPIEFTLPRWAYEELGGYTDAIRPLSEVLEGRTELRREAQAPDNPWPYLPQRPTAGSSG